MNNLPETVTQALAEFRERLSELYGNRLVRIVLYGSFARGDFQHGSDVDIAVVLRGEVGIGEEMEHLSPIAGDVSLRYRLVPETRWKERQSPLLLNLRREGVAP
jgi:predicted nucleotidyltransferase